ncbi:hypothetical protein SUGI_0097380 [Cryptomeria japonica]|uniref:uncharacterized protein LOC131062524 n=1 Tax=Cryptomeria japonica TaxID=3369 RepID=UPI002408BA3B|nr:uncharacterized protein LOC131062524 [Cryptomeria japonica]XP_057852193.1 uncharacterized protein LOC131062524 [Cryptomeria japonica]XP_057852194.1 uncharacterized protein LOC131062524 [Cryptomeria japonica]XP_057852197.1 uncharacterized protein LOC131062524 [Cryptomeria japonica]XP_057852198.1 uncharacterized protein LOC131062524 [Cryptomeria japonica]GLJ08870.1 hypothetical protein SUGI_0097380 [Cryptomeria japonica]
MGLIRSGVKVSRNSSHSQTQSSSSTDDELHLKENHPYQDDSGADSDTTDESDVAEVGAELCMVGDQTCSVPYELFDLPDLKQILSLDTWNNVLTEEERYNLTAYLPDMDQQSFNLTLKQLLGGEVLHFNSSMTELFNRLKGGLCSPKVAQYREGLLYLQRKEHYHSLRKYHNNMVSTCLEMCKVWKNCSSGAGVEDRIRIWNSLKSQKKISQADPQALIAYTKQGEASRKGKSGKPPTQTNKKAKPSQSQGLTDTVYPSNQGNIVTTTKADGKGVLKVKAPSKSTFPSESNTVKLESKDTLKLEKRTPKGVLKIVSKPPVRHEQAPFQDTHGYEAQIRPSLHSQAMSGWDGDSYVGETSFGLSKSKDRKRKNDFESESAVAQQPFDYYSNAGTGKNVSGYDKKMKKVKEQPIHNNISTQMPVWYGHDARNFEEDDNLTGGKRFMKDLTDNRRYMQEGSMLNEDIPYTEQRWRHMDKQNREYQRSPVGHYADVGDWKTPNYHQPFPFERQMNYTNRELDLEGPGNFHGEQNLIPKTMERSKKKRKEVRQSFEDPFRLNEQNFAEDHRDKHDYLKEQSNFVGNRRQLLDAGGLLDDTKWSDQSRFMNEQKRRKKSQIGDSSLDLERNFEEPLAFEGTQHSKKTKRKKDQGKGESTDFFVPHQPVRAEYDVKAVDGQNKVGPVKIKFKNRKDDAKIPHFLTEGNGPQDHVQSSLYSEEDVERRA